MSSIRKIAIAFLALIGTLLVASIWLVPADPVEQSRDAIAQPPSRQALLGTDELGRDNLARLLAGLRLSILLACAGAAVSCCVAMLLGAVSGLIGGWLESVVLGGIALVESIPWIFLFLTVRALLPLNVATVTSVWITFSLLALLGWTHAARIVQAAAADLRNSGAFVFARACGIHGWRLWLGQTLPNLRAVSLNQFLLLIPTFILAESGLGLLGLGVAEPLPSLGNLLRQLENQDLVRTHPVVFVPLIVLAAVMLSFRIACGDLETQS